ncbi:hypothetical protein D6810_01835 [Candidatus Dojkabacteria bacterium]|uniref:Yip1 domain-containing protein n=1 Tax=Candidatus Dojkabacteria bacterium TaxID=2099670 RepID=A0A3M0YZL3_9BACT|nr:MAG: hypothetical protein D6810_01835 [Candidatus Dojkabacteria bacterium]
MFQAVWNTRKFFEEGFHRTSLKKIAVWHLIFLLVGSVFYFLTIIFAGNNFIKVVLATITSILVFVLFTVLFSFLNRSFFVNGFSFKENLKVSLGALLPYTFLGNFVNGVMSLFLLPPMLMLSSITNSMTVSAPDVQANLSAATVIGLLSACLSLLLIPITVWAYVRVIVSTANAYSVLLGVRSQDLFVKVLISAVMSAILTSVISCPLIVISNLI